jgi:hypothetical protein
MQNERTSWNEKYRAGSHTKLDSDPFLEHAFQQFGQPFFPMGALDWMLPGMPPEA